MPTTSSYKRENDSDEDLLRRSQEGDRAAFAQLVRRYEGPLFNYLRRILQNAEDAEEVFQEAFMRVYKHLNDFRADGRFRPWLYRIATNLARDRLRTRKRRGELPLDAPTRADAACGRAPLESLASPNPGPEEAARYVETRERLEAAVAALPVKQRAVFLMARIENIPYAEIARCLRVPLGTVKSRMNKAVRFLMARLEKEMP